MSESTTELVSTSTEVAAPKESDRPAKAFLQKSQAELERSIARYPNEVIEDTVWAQNFCRDVCNGNLTLLQATSEKLGYKRSVQYYYNILNGHYFRARKQKEGEKSSEIKYEGNVSDWREIVDALRKHERQMTTSGKYGIIETPTYRCIANFINERRAPGAACKFGGITGPTGAQKSALLKYYRLLNNHGKVIYLEAPARRSLQALQRKIAEQYDANVGNCANVREASIRDNVREDRTIIIDNAQNLYFPGKGRVQPSFDYLRELQDDTGCTIILCFTEEFVDGDLTANHAKNYFEQFIGRMGGLQDLLRLPAWTPVSDLRVIARAFKLIDGPSALDYLKAWSRLPGRVRLVFLRLQRAKQFAQLDGRDRITLEDLKLANDFIPPAFGEDTESEDAA